MTDYTEIRNDKIRGKICELMSEMLDNPDEHGIFPTSRFMWKMETFVLAKIERLRKALPDPNKLRTLAAWFDLQETTGKFPEWSSSHEVQEDLRRWAESAEITPNHAEGAP